MAFAALRPVAAPRTVDPRSRALAHLLHRKLMLGWVKWHGDWAERAREHVAMRMSVSYMFNRGLLLGLGAWVELAVERAAFLQVLRKGMGFIMIRQVAMAC